MIFNRKYKNNPKIVAIAAGSSGGHIFPGIAIAEKLLEDNYKIFFITDHKFSRFISRDSEIIQNPNFEVVYLKIMNAYDLKDRLRQILTLCLDIFKVFKLCIKSDISVLIAFGSRVSLVSSIAAWFAFKKILIHEQNSIMGLANRISMFLCSYCLISFEQTEKIPKIFRNKCIFTGNPVRKEIKKLQYENNNNSINYQAFFRINNNINIAIIGGSQGSSAFDDLIPYVLIKLLPEIREKLRIVHQTSLENVDRVRLFYDSHNIKAIVESFFFNIHEILSSSHLIISRAGSTIISEITILGVPSILIPLPNSKYNHQFFNAKFLRDGGGAILLEQNELNQDKFLILLGKLFSRDSMLYELSIHAKALAQTNADLKIKTVIDHIINHTKEEIYENKLISDLKKINNNIATS